MKDLSKYKIGFRTIKTGISVGLSMYIASIFSLKNPVFVGIGAIMTMQSSVSRSFIEGKNRMLGTFVGAILGLLFSFFLPRNFLFLGLGIIVVIYIHNALNWKQSLSLSAIVFLAIFLNNESESIAYASNRILDTFIGISVSVLVNFFIATPNIEKIIVKRETSLYNTSKSMVYDLVSNKCHTDLNTFAEEMDSLKQLFCEYKHDLELNVLKSTISEFSISILNILEDIYNELVTIFKLDISPILNIQNVELFKKLYSKEFVPCAMENDELNIVYNYHLNKILLNLLEIEELLKKSSES